MWVIVHDGKGWLQGCVPLAEAKVRLDWKGFLRWKSLNLPVCWGWHPAVDQYDTAIGGGQLDWGRLTIPQDHTCLPPIVGERPPSLPGLGSALQGVP